MDTSANVIRDFITSGRATFTLTSRKSGTRFTYRVRKTDDRDGVYFVSVLTGPDNEGDYTYAGMLGAGKALGFRQTPGSKVARTAPSVMGFEWLLAMINHGRDIGELAEFDPMGQCGRCGRDLTDPESIRTGLGPVCRTKV